MQDDGLVIIYNMFGQYQHTFGMGQEAKDTKVIDAKIFPSSSGTGVAVMTSNFRIFLINSIKDPKIRQLPEMPSMCGQKINIRIQTCYIIIFCFFFGHRIDFGSNLLDDNYRRTQHMLSDCTRTRTIQIETG